MGDLFGIELAKARQDELLREAEQRRLARSTQGRYPGRVGYRHRGRGWHLDVGRLSGADSRRGPLRGTLKS